MPNFTEKIKTTWFKCVETIGQGAANMADNAKQKLGEISTEARRKEMVAELPKMLMQLWKDGAELPEELNATLSELNTLEEELAAIRAARQAKRAKPAITDGSDAQQEETVEETEEVAEETACEPSEEEASCEEATAEVAENEAAPEAAQSEPEYN